MTGLGSASSTIIGNLELVERIEAAASGLTHGYAFTPSTNIQVTAVRCVQRGQGVDLD